MPVEGKEILRIDVTVADRHDKPVYIGPGSIKGHIKGIMSEFFSAQKKQ